VRENQGIRVQDYFVFLVNFILAVTVTENLVSYFFGNDDQSSGRAKTAPPPTESMLRSNDFIIGNLDQITINPEDAKEKVSFPLPAFTVPDRFTLYRTEVFLPDQHPNNLSNKIRYTFKDTENKILRITVEKLEEHSNLGSGTNEAGSNTTKIHLRNGATGYLTTSTDGSIKIEFLTGNLYVLIIGVITNEEMDVIANSFSF
jgi:hypothetical protein